MRVVAEADQSAPHATQTPCAAAPPPCRHHAHGFAQCNFWRSPRFLIEWIFLGDLRSAIIVGVNIPFALFFAIILLVFEGEDANLLSSQAQSISASSLIQRSF